MLGISLGPLGRRERFIGFKIPLGHRWDIHESLPSFHEFPMTSYKGRVNIRHLHGRGVWVSCPH